MAAPLLKLSVQPHSSFQRLNHRTRKLIVFTPLVFLLILSLPQPDQPTKHALEFRKGCEQNPPDGGDCEAIGPRRPQWACQNHMRESIAEFLKIYRQRPIDRNIGGMRFDHSFALWYTLRAIEPRITTVIESGTYHGQGTWIIRKALPEARILSIDPREPRYHVSGVEYLTVDRFVDFKYVDWESKHIDFDTTAVFFGDHQSGFRRIIEEGMELGFSHFLTEDNYAYLKGDNMSIKWVCERTRANLWPGFVLDNFGKYRIKQTWKEHLDMGEQLKENVQEYYEFPPLATSECSGQTRFDEKYTTKALIDDEEEFGKISKGLHEDEFFSYTHFLYVKTFAKSSEDGDEKE